jgi:hydroxymethylglutaryl-CoA reductase
MGMNFVKSQICKVRQNFEKKSTPPQCQISVSGHIINYILRLYLFSIIIVDGFL